jgi:hypothetical protein
MRARAFTATEFTIYRSANEVRPVFIVIQNSLDAIEGPCREPRLHVFGPLLLSAHSGRI